MNLKLRKKVVRSVLYQKRFTDDLTDVKCRGTMSNNFSQPEKRNIYMKNRIEQLKREKNAVILAHYYVPDAVQEIADYVGDSFHLAKVAKQSSADRIVFCGVSFMGESAKILNPRKTVLMPDISADCPMAHMVEPMLIEEMRRKYEDLAVVCYINSTASLKCYSDVCVTSSNAVKIVRSLPNRNIFFIPDRNLGQYVAAQVPEKNIILNDGCCPVHAAITAESLRREKEAHPDALVLSHPECEPEILAMSDFIGSTAGILARAKKEPVDEFIVCTEKGILYQLMADSPGKRFYFPQPHPCCDDMKRNTLTAVLSVLEQEDRIVEVDEAVRLRALLPLNRMLELG